LANLESHKEAFIMDDIKKPEEQVSAAPAELTQAELDKVAGGADKTKDEETIRNA
jgi:hypothetical protein